MISFPFTLLYLLLYATAVHTRRALRKADLMKTIHVQEPGGPENMKLVDAPAPQPGPKQALVRLHASGVNFIDVYFRIGLYKADLPITLGNEGAGVVEAVGAGVTEVAPGDRVAYAMARGSYARIRRGAGGAAREDSRPPGFPHGRGRHAAGHDGPLPDAFHSTL